MSPGTKRENLWIIFGVILVSIQLLFFNWKAIGSFNGFTGTPAFVHDPLTNYREAALFFLHPSLSFFRYPDWFLFSWPALLIIKVFHWQLSYRLITLLTSIFVQTGTLLLLLLFGKQLRLHPLAQILSVSMLWSCFLFLPLVSFTEIGFMGDTSAGLGLLVLLFSSVLLLQSGFTARNLIFFFLALLFCVHTKSIAITLSVSAIGWLFVFFPLTKRSPPKAQPRKWLVLLIMASIGFSYWLFFPRSFLNILYQMYLANGQSHYFWIHERGSLYLLKSLLTEYTNSIRIGAAAILATIFIYCFRFGPRQFFKSEIFLPLKLYLALTTITGISIFSLVATTDARNCFSLMPSLTLVFAILFNVWLCSGRKNIDSYKACIIALLIFNIFNLSKHNSMLDKTSYEQEGAISSIDIIKEDIARSRSKIEPMVFLPHHSHAFNFNTFWSAELLRHPLKEGDSFPETGFRIASAPFLHNPFSKDPSSIPTDFFSSQYIVLVTGERNGEKNNGEDIQNLLIFDNLLSKNPTYLEGLKLFATTSSQHHGTILIFKRQSEVTESSWLNITKDMLKNDLCNRANSTIITKAISIAPKDTFLIDQQKCIQEINKG